VNVLLGCNIIRHNASKMRSRPGSAADLRGPLRDREGKRKRDVKETGREKGRRGEGKVEGTEGAGQV